MPSPPLWLVLWLLSLFSLGLAQSPVQTFFPAAIPLSIRSPYMSVWQKSMNGGTPLSSSWPLFWGLQSIMGWAGKIRVDGQTYSWLGDDYGPPFVANVTNVQITPTRSIFVMQAGPMNVTVTFLSPIEPSDWVLQSLPFSFVSVEASSLDGQPHDVQVYSDISAEWLSGDRSSPVRWSQHSTEQSIYHEIDLQFPQQGVEINHQAQDGIAYYAMANRSGLTWQIDNDTNSRGQFHDHGVLTNTFTTAFAPISPTFTVFAISVDLGSSTTFGPVTWAVGYVRNPSISYTTPDSNVEQLRPYFVTRYGVNNIGAAIDAWTTSFSDIQARAIAFDEAVMGNASKVSSHYVDLVSLATRQTLGSLDITVSTDSTGQPNASDVRIFMKDIGSSTVTERVNPVERIYAALPALLYVNASLVGPLLRPLLDAQDNLTTPYAAPDIGTAYPNATGVDTSQISLGVEQTGNMLIMLYAHARFSGDGSLLSSHYDLTKRWANYLVNQVLTSSNQNDADGQGAANMTNLVIKGIIGVKAMAEISRALGQDLDAQQYDSHAAALVGSWQSLATSSDQQHILGTYGDQSSWALMYNIYADLLLGTNIVSQTLLKSQTAFYNSLFNSGNLLSYGIPLDSFFGHQTSAAWQLFTAATVQDSGVQGRLIDGVWARANYNGTSGTFPDAYDASTGATTSGTAGPAVGGLFSILALSLPNVTIHVDPSLGQSPGDSNGGKGGEGSDSHKTSIGAIVGGVVGGIAVVAVVALAVFFYMRKRRRAHQLDDGEKVDAPAEPHRPTLSPYTYTPQGESPVSPQTHPLEAGTFAEANLSGPLDTIGSNTSLVPPGSFDRTGFSGSSERPGSGGSSSKMRERELNARLAYAPSISGSSNAASNTGSASSRDPLSPSESRSRGGRSGTRSGRSGSAIGSGSGSRSNVSLTPTDVLGLRAEVENLRRVMQEIRAERLEPPPEYTG
ncbi:hypothetical protein ONZ51_g4652 [Trametes cubensis]|uniref:DUF1793-domain-containing protein n=1 Tax=Trametes cubensis TaxID=1111947 RepID=A0AAD7XA36_9APHY|nr:hypothetical protein ONZ51_g4652 [Trametes cubensis]